jgi:hypothetical protein
LIIGSFSQEFELFRETQSSGRATALLFAKCGTRVAVIDRNEITGKETVQLIKQQFSQTQDSEKPTAIFIRADVSVAEGVILQRMSVYLLHIEFVCCEHYRC